MPNDVPLIEKLFNLLECLNFSKVGLTADQDQIIYEHSEKNRGFSKWNRIYLPVSRVTNFDLGRRIHDDLLNGFGFSQQEIMGCCDGFEFFKQFSK